MLRKGELAFGLVVLAAGVAFAHDIVIYGSTPAAISAAVQAKRSGKSAVVVSPERRIGGMTTGGLGQTDGARLSCYGGIAKEFYRAVKRHYDDPAAWMRQRQETYRSRAWADESGGADTMWTFEPSVALKILEGWEKRDGLEIVRGERLDRTSKRGVAKKGGRIVAMRTESGRVFEGQVFIDATYEGDLMAEAGVSYAVGREDNATYGETVNGIQRTLCGKGHRFVAKVDPYVEKGNPASGLLKYVEKDVEAPDGTGDRRVQAYCFRLCLTTDPENRVPFEKPEGYDERDYELAFRDFEGRTTGMVWLNPPMPNLKSDCNSGGAVSLDFIGGSDRWPEASYAEREKIFAAHVRWQKGLLWTYANHPRIPAELRREISRWGLARDEFADSGNWPTQLYVREGRRMVGKYVITENDCRRRCRTPKPVLQASFNMDSHNVRRVVGKDGFVFNEGDVQAAPLPPFHLVSYDALVPKDAECANLIVPVCLSASHVAFGSIRMEPMFFGLGQVAGLAAARALDDGVAVQDVSYTALRRDLDAAGIPSGDTEQAPVRKVRLMSFNIRMGCGHDDPFSLEKGSLGYLPKCADVIRAVEPDVVGLQEVDRNSKRAGYLDQTAEMAKLCGLHGEWVEKVPNYGISTLSRQKPLRVEKILMKGSLHTRALMIEEFPDYVVAHTHFPLAEWACTNAAAVVCRTLADYSAVKPVFLMGDFNSQPDSAAMRLIKRDFVVLSDESKPTWPAKCPDRTIDFILVDWKHVEAVKVARPRIICAPEATDHAALVVDVELRQY